MDEFVKWLEKAMFEKGGMSYRWSNLANDIDVRNATISEWKNKKRHPTRYHIEKLARHFGVTARHIYELLGEEPPADLNDVNDEIQVYLYKLPPEGARRLLKDLKANKYG